MNHDEKDAGLKVVDRRAFDESGAPRTVEETVAEAAPVPPPPPQTPAAETSAPKTETGGAPRGSLQQLSFGHFCLSLAGSTQVALGLIPNPQTNLTTKDLGAARQTIDLLGMLQEKTKGNLTTEEAGLLEELLYTLRMQYIEVTKPKVP
ncbi:MAG: DUF1844 domain-containing protein [Deltaproteobacteria bacterium]|nr:DUF1844 domain-containing protein [Deltaproteobacteria bacterium]